MPLRIRFFSSFQFHFLETFKLMRKSSPYIKSRKNWIQISSQSSVNIITLEKVALCLLFFIMKLRIMPKSHTGCNLSAWLSGGSQWAYPYKSHIKILAGYPLLGTLNLFYFIYISFLLKLSLNGSAYGLSMNLTIKWVKHTSVYQVKMCKWNLLLLIMKTRGFELQLGSTFGSGMY